MPVDFHAKNAKVVPRGALVMLMHASEIAEGNYWQKVIAREAIKTLGDARSMRRAALGRERAVALAAGACARSAPTAG